MEERKDGFSDLKDLVDFMKREGVLKLQTANCSIEVHPAYLGRTSEDLGSQTEQRDESKKMSREEVVSRAKRALNELSGSI